MKEDLSGETTLPSSGEVWALRIAAREGRRHLTQKQYSYVVALVKRLVDFGDDQEMWDLDIQPIGEFFELRLKGNLLGKINLRVFFKYYPRLRRVVVLKTYKKEEEGKTRRHVILNLEQRQEDYEAGLRQDALIKYRRD